MTQINHIVDRQEVLMLIDLIEGALVPMESKLRAIKRLEIITGRELPGTKAFRKLRDEYSKGDKDENK